MRGRTVAGDRLRRWVQRLDLAMAVLGIIGYAFNERNKETHEARLILPHNR
jgi:hypothetical protein